MENQVDNNVSKINKFAIKSLVASTLSLLLYTLSLPLIFNTNEWYLIAIIVSIGGVTLCIISLNAGNKSFKQFKKADNPEKGFGIAVTGRILGILGVIASIFYCLLMVAGLLTFR